jgi:MFS family permease
MRKNPVEPLDPKMFKELSDKLTDVNHEPPSPSKHKIHSVNCALDRLQGTMRYQKVFVFLLIISFICGNRFLTMYPFLQLYPTLLCPNANGTYYECSQVTACSAENKDKYVVDTEGRYTLNNWMVNIHLICNERYEIGMQGTLLFMGQTIGAIFFTHWADVYGRKIVLLVAGAGYAVVIIASTFAQTLM